jgi:ribonuclease-3
MKNYIKNIEKIINIKFTNKELLLKSFIHKSFDKKINNEKLEFLGDRVIGLIISKKLINLYPDESEGIIDKKFARLVNKKTCADVFRNLNLKRYIRTGNSFKALRSSDEKILSDTCEALIGSIYSDQGFQIAEKFVLKIWNIYIKDSDVIVLDPKTKLQEFALKKFKKLPIYKTLEKSGPNHNPFFQVSVQIQNSKKFQGEGSSKKIAQQNAASNLIKNLKI